MTPDSNPAAPADLFASLSARFEAVWRSSGAVPATTHRCGGRHVLLRAVGEELLDHLRTVLPVDRGGSTAPSLALDLWDVEATGVAPSVAGVAAAFSEHWPVAVGWMGRSEDGRFVADQRRESLFVLDRTGGRIVGWIESFAALSLNERSKPVGRVLRSWLGDLDLSVAHAALVARNGRGALVLGAKGAGKSTTALACLLAGLDFVSDDLVALEEVEAGVLGHALNHSILLERARAEDLDGEAAAMLRPRFPADRKLLLVPPPERVVASARLVALLVPRRAGCGETRLRPAHDPELFRRVISSTMATMSPRPGVETLRILVRMFQQVPSFWLETGTIEQVGEAISRHLAADTTA